MPSCRCATIELQSRFGDLPFLHAAAAAALDAAGLTALAQRLDRPARLPPWSVSILTVCWPFGTLPARIERRRFCFGGPSLRRPERSVRGRPNRARIRRLT